LSINILHITPDFNYACGRSYYVYLLLKFFNRGKRVFLITNGGDSLERLDELNINYKIVLGLNQKNPLSLSKNIIEIRNFIKNYKINIVHTHHRYAELEALQAIKMIRRKKPKTVFTALSLVKRRYNIEYRSDKIIAVSECIKKMLIDKFKVDNSKISLIPNFTDTSELGKPKLSTSKKNRYYNILAIGRFHWEKNFELLLKAVFLLNDNNIHVVLIGAGEERLKYISYISRHKLNAEILDPQKDLLNFFLNADLCVLPSINDPFPSFMLQSGLHKKPFIGSNIEGISELIKNDENGLLFESGNASDLAEKIKMMKNNDELAKRCAVSLHLAVINNYTQNAVIPKIENLYKELFFNI
jgi:glycosyltransferase involved in cell wall biosynthesis